jgi:rhodanese-related sulfurtransferase
MSINKITKTAKIHGLALLLIIVFCQNMIAAGSSVSVSPQTITVTSVGDAFTIDIIVDSAGSEVYGAQYELYFDNTILDATSQTQGVFISQDGASTNVFNNTINNNLGKIVYAESRMGTPAGVIGSGVLASITFDTIKSGTSTLTLSYVMLVDSSGKDVVTTVNSGTCMAGDIMAEVTYTDIPVEEANYMSESDPEVIILDVSNRDKYDSEHITDARWIQVSNASAISELDEYRDWSIIVYSRGGIGSREACSVLIEHGFENVYNMVGGINAWRVNFPVVSALKPTPTKIPASSPSETVTASSTPTILDTSSESKRLPGFEVSFTIAGLLAALILRRMSCNDIIYCCMFLCHISLCSADEC